MTGTSDPASGQEPTRLIAMGTGPLTDGFRLIGFETVPEANSDDVETLLAELLNAAARGETMPNPVDLEAGY